MTIRLKATWTTHASVNAPDEYELTVRRRKLRSSEDAYSLSRIKSFQFERTQGRGRRITVSGEEAKVVDKRAGKESDSGSFGIQRLSSGLSTLPRLASSDGGEEVSKVAQQLSTFRVFDVDVPAARIPARLRRSRFFDLSPDADNLAEFLYYGAARQRPGRDFRVRLTVSAHPAKRSGPSCEGAAGGSIGVRATAGSPCPYLRARFRGRPLPAQGVRTSADHVD
ncbi:hypothetical protein [Streptomyces sp. JH34]|uniref:hypothetical protein n=1 Tax=Streptomyces sp. JH34 TaxID=2793633 RepID=UPI0023F9E8F5|nr:hypothetical protein [Streptomyces sp. JH34]MDF6017811.1 hypothetical protein [Streptomyces sp. JH34]